jgi:NCS1 family nucleobase:cation symporter-1
MHGGLSDMALLRYARRASYGLFSAFGMFLGHYLAWICAGLMGGGVAVLLGRSLPQLDAGEVGFQALGWSGILAVVIAGWTTSNPTLYRAGLALQAVTPNWSRARVTLVAGAVTTVIACFPFVFTRLLEFVGIYGLLLAPPGAIVLVEHWIFPRIGLQRYWTEHQRRALNVPAAVAWGVSIAMALALERSGTLHLFYLFVPTYLTAAVLYTVLAAMAGARRVGAGEPQAARQPSFIDGPTPISQPDGRGKSGGGLAGLVALAALVVCLVLPLAAGFGYTSREIVRAWLIVPTIVYFVSGVLFYRSWRDEQTGSA